jgi:hypothetical protein
MKLVNLKNDADDTTCCAMPMEQYGYGLRLYLDDDACEKLGITKPLAVGTQVVLQAKAIVVSSTASIDSDGDGGQDVCLSLQLTDLGLEASGVLRNAAQVLYGGD